MSKKPNIIPYAFQPIYETTCEKKLFGYEALVRPTDFKTPAEYIKSMEQSGKIHQLEFESFYNAVMQFRDRGLKGHLFVNSFPYEFLNDDEWEQIKQLSPEIFKKIHVESLEYGERINVLKLAAKVEHIRKQGLHVVVDDFGSGLNSISAINILNPEIIKIDRFFISGCTKSQMCKNTVEIIVDCIRSHKAKVLAEGVETYDEFRFLRFLGVDYMQGYYLGTPE